MFQYKANLYLICNFLHMHPVIKFNMGDIYGNKKNSHYRTGKFNIQNYL